MVKGSIFRILSIVLSTIAFHPIAVSQETGSTQTNVQSTVATQKPVVYDKYQDAAAAANGQLLSIDRSAATYSGYSVMPFGNRKKSVDEALTSAAKSPNSNFLVIADGRQVYGPDAPPPGSFWGGTYWVYRLLPIKYVALTGENLLAEIRAHATSRPMDGSVNLSLPHIQALAEIAKDPAYGSLTTEYRAIIRGANDERIDGYAMPSLIGLIAFHEGKNCTDDLLRWAKYHKNSQARLASYRVLISQGKQSDVEEILKLEENKAVKEAVKKELI
jgi:hypothetical protein